MVELQWQTKVNRKDVSIVQALTFSDENPKFTIIIWDIFLLKKVMIRAYGWTLKLVCTNFISVYTINESYLVSPFTVPCCMGLLSPFCSISVWSGGVITTEEAEGRPKPGCAPFFYPPFRVLSFSLCINKLPEKGCRAGRPLAVCEYWRKKSKTVGGVD